MTIYDVYEELKNKAKGGAKHSSMVEFLMHRHECGYDMSDDRTLIVGYFNEGVIVVAPYHQVTLVLKVKP